MRINKSSIFINEDNIPYLETEFVKNYPKEKSLNSPKKIANCMKDIFKLDKMPEEYAYVITFNTKNKPITFFELSHGTTDMTIMDPKNILTRVLLTGAPNIVLIHSHPSGDPMPSENDIIVTKRIEDACKIVGVNLLDHIIIGKDYYSMREHALISD